jgi:hypothetical protein
MENKPTYPRPNLEYAKITYDQFLKRVRNTKWEDTEDYKYTSRGRKPKPYVRPESRPRSEGEKQVYDWLKKIK